MAITKHEPTQPCLSDLAPSNPDTDFGNYLIPSRDDINFDEAEFILDVDLDELDVYFEDRTKPYTVEELADDYSLMIDALSDRVVGVVINQFYSRLLPNHPEFIPVLRYATVIAGKSVQNPPVTATEYELPDERARTGLMSSKRDAVEGIVRLIGID